MFTPDVKTQTQAQASDIPNINGSKNSSGANQPIPIVIGQSYYTPIYAANNYTTINPEDGSDGENQYLNALYTLGQGDIDLNSVSLGIYKLSNDEKNGTSGSLSCDIIRGDITNTDSQKFNDVTFTSLNSTKITATITKTYKENDIVKSVNVTPVCSNGHYEKYRIFFSRKINKEIVYFSPTNVSLSTVIKDNTVTYTITMDKPSGLVLPNDPVYCNVQLNGKVVINQRETRYRENEYFQKLELQQGHVVYSNDGVNFYSDKARKNKVTLPQNIKPTPLKDSGVYQYANEVSLYPQKVVQENLGVELLHYKNTQPLVCYPFSAKYPQKVQFEIKLSNLVHFKNDGGMEATSLKLGIAYSIDGGDTYLPFPGFKKSSNSISFSNDTKEFSNDSDKKGSYTLCTISGLKNRVMRFIAEKEFLYNEIKDAKNHVIEIIIWRDTVDESENDSKYQYKVYTSAIRTWVYDYTESEKKGDFVPQYPVTERDRNLSSRLGFSVKAGNELKDTIDELNVIETFRGRYCTVSYASNNTPVYTWSDKYDTKPTCNPASIVLWLLQNDTRGEYALNDSQLDLNDFGKLWKRCEETDTYLDMYNSKRFVTNGVISSQKKTIDLVNSILSHAHASLTMRGSKYGIFIDEKQIESKLIINNQNLLERTNSKSFSDDIDGYQVTFINALLDYQQDTIVCVDNIAKQKKEADSNYQYKLETIELPFVTDAKRVYRECMWKLALKRLRPETWTAKVGLDGELVEIGDLIELQDDTIAVGIGDGAEIKDVVIADNYITKVITDYPFNVTDSSKNYGLKIQCADGVSSIKIVTKQVKITQAGKYNTLEFIEPISLDEEYKISIGDICSFGIFEKISTPALCVGKKGTGEGTTTLTFVPYSDELYEDSTITGNIPEFVSNVTNAKDSGLDTPEELPVVTMEDVSDAVSSAVTVLQYDKLQLDLTPEMQTIYFNEDTGISEQKYFDISAFLYYANEYVTSNVIYKAYINDSVVGIWGKDGKDRNIVTISSSYLKGDILEIKIVATAEIRGETYERTAIATINKVFTAESSIIYKMLLPDGEKIKTDSEYKEFNPSIIRANKRKVTSKGETDTNYGKITVETSPVGEEIDIKETFQLTEDIYVSDKDYYTKYQPVMLKIDDNTVIAVSKDIAGVFYRRSKQGSDLRKGI